MLSRLKSLYALTDREFTCFNQSWKLLGLIIVAYGEVRWALVGIVHKE
jgi:hypothetical protein